MFGIEEAIRRDMKAPAELEDIIRVDLVFCEDEHRLVVNWFEEAPNGKRG
jgi:hypothetical protein